MRDKEGLQDYRFMPEPNLPPLFVYKDVASVPDGFEPAHVVLIDRLQAQLPELPRVKRTKLIEEYGILPEHSFTLVNEDGLMEFFDRVVQKTKMEPRKLIGWVIKELMGNLNQQNLKVTQSPVSPEALAQLLNLLDSDSISSSAAKVVFQEMWKTPEKRVDQLVKELDLGLISDREQLVKICQKVIETHPDLVQVIRRGNKKVLNKMMGAVQKELKGRADPVQLRNLLEEMTS